MTVGSLTVGLLYSVCIMIKILWGTIPNNIFKMSMLFLVFLHLLANMFMEVPVLIEYMDL